jgi:hypothetical protein
MATWTSTALSLVLVSVLVQAIVAWWLLASLDSCSDYSSMPGRTRAVGSNLALVAFALYTFFTAFFGRNNPWKFVENLPFKPVHQFVQHFGFLATPAGRSDLASIYGWIHLTLAFVVPCVIFVIINAALSSMIWDGLKDRRNGGFA